MLDFNVQYPNWTTSGGTIITFKPHIQEEPRLLSEKVTIRANRMVTKSRVKIKRKETFVLQIRTQHSLNISLDY